MQVCTFKKNINVKPPLKVMWIMFNVSTEKKSKNSLQIGLQKKTQKYDKTDSENDLIWT